MLEAYGKPGCPSCGGRGRVAAENPPGYRGPPSVRLCRCVLLAQFAANMDRSWRGLSKAERVRSSPLLDLAETDTWVTAHEPWIKAHLRHVAYRRSLRWEFRVVSDADLLTAWLATAAIDGAKIYDGDMLKSMEEGEYRRRPSFAYLTLKDIAEPSDLLIVKLGDKKTPNREMPNVLLETIRCRQSAGKATWVWDQPLEGMHLEEETHRCHSFEVMEEVSSWARIREAAEQERAPVQVAPKIGSFFPAAAAQAAEHAAKAAKPAPEAKSAEAILEELVGGGPEPEPEPEPEVDEDNPLAAVLSRSGDDASDRKHRKTHKKKGFRS